MMWSFGSNGTALMAGYVKTFIELNPDKEPDEIKLTVKVIGLD